MVQRLAYHLPACFQGKFLANRGGDSMGSRPLCYHADRRNRAFSIVASHVHCVMVSRNNKESTFSCITTHLLLRMIIFNTFSALGRVNSLLERIYIYIKWKNSIKIYKIFYSFSLYYFILLFILFNIRCYSYSTIIILVSSKWEKSYCWILINIFLINIVKYCRLLLYFKKF